MKSGREEVRKQSLMRALMVAAVVLVPVKYLSGRVGGVDITAHRLALAGLALATVATLRHPEHRRRLVAVLRHPFAVAAAAMAAWAVVCAVVGAVRAPSDVYARRAAAGGIAMVLGFYVLPVVVLAELRRGDRVRAVFAWAVRVWWILVLFAFVQVALVALDLPVNAITISEDVVRPVSNVLGADLLRPYSLFGEPRDLASFLLPIVLLHGFLRSRGPSTLHAVVVGLLGVLLASYTFYAVFFAYLAYWLVVERRSFGLRPAALAMLVVLPVAVPVLSAAVGGGEGSRVIGTIDEFELVETTTTTTTIGSPAGPGSETDGPPTTAPDAPDLVEEPVETPAYNQAPDLLVRRFAEDVIRGDVSPVDLVFGHGVGSFTVVVNDYYVRYFRYDLVADERVVGSRLFPFVLVVETGLVGLALYAALFVLSLVALQRAPITAGQRSATRLVLVGLWIGSAAQTSYMFMVGSLLALSAAALWSARSAEAASGGPEATHSRPTLPS